MKKINVLLLLTILSTTWLEAQEPNGNIAQPKNVIGRKLNGTGEVTREYVASFDYISDGKLNSFLFPDWGVSSAYFYEDDFLTTIRTHHDGAWPNYSDVLRYTYEKGRVVSEAHEWDAMNSNEYITYTYYEDGRLARKDYASYHPDAFWGFSLYEYENEGKTRIESYSSQTFQGSSLVMQLEYRITNRYDNNYNLISSQKDNYNTGEITNSARTLYAYTPDGKIETEISQTFVEKNWINNTIRRYLYENEDHVIEQQDGNWSSELNDWEVSKKIIHEYSQENMTYTVSFYKKNGTDWVRDIFNGQKLFFLPELKLQQAAMNFFAYEDLLGSTQVNQFEFEMIYTKTPTYHLVEKTNQILFSVYPNPGKDVITISAPIENTVIRFYDLQGRLQFARPFDFNTTISIGDWAQGIYLWEIWNGTQREACGKWVKE